MIWSSLPHLAFDPVRGQPVSASDFSSPSLWFFGAPNAATREDYGAGCGAAPPRLGWFGLPRLGQTGFALDVLAAPAGAPVGVLLGGASAALPLPSGCTLLVDPSSWLASLGARSSPSGFASFPLPIPRDRALLGATLTSQALALDPAASGGPAWSAGVRGQVGY